jgi:hypothetical protein
MLICLFEMIRIALTLRYDEVWMEILGLCMIHRRTKNGKALLNAGLAVNSRMTGNLGRVGIRIHG